MNNLQLQSIQEFVYSESVNIADPQHSLDHAHRVKFNAIKIAKILKLEKDLDLNLLTGMSLLHDMHYSQHKPGIKTYLFERRLAKKYLKKYIAQFNIKEEEEKLIIEAITNHPHSYPLRRLNRKKNHYTKILQDADTLDFFSDSRLKSLDVSKQKFFFYKFIWFLGQKLYLRDKKKINKFLNYPELVKYLTGFNIS